MLRTTRPRRISGEDIATLRSIERTNWTATALQLGVRDDEEVAARAISLGGIGWHPFGNTYAVTSHPGEAVVEYADHVVGPALARGGITTTLRYVPQIFDWTRLPAPLTAVRVMELIDALFQIGPFGFIGPADARIPLHLTRGDGTVRLVGPGYACRSNVVLERAMELAGTHMLRSVLVAETARVAGVPGCFVVERSTRTEYAAYRDGLPTVIRFDALADAERSRPTLRIEYDGSLHIDHLRPILDSLGFGFELARHAAEQGDAVLAA